jgi:hypothetical protein
MMMVQPVFSIPSQIQRPSPEKGADAEEVAGEDIQLGMKIGKKTRKRLEQLGKQTMVVIEAEATEEIVVDTKEVTITIGEVITTIEVVIEMKAIAEASQNRQVEVGTITIMKVEVATIDKTTTTMILNVVGTIKEMNP